MKNLDKIRAAVPLSERLAQLAEEAAEMAQAALKLRRAIDGANPTPVSVWQAWRSLAEEYADVSLCIDTLELSGGFIHAVCSTRESRPSDG